MTLVISIKEVQEYFMEEPPLLPDWMKQLGVLKGEDQRQQATSIRIASEKGQVAIRRSDGTVVQPGAETHFLLVEADRFLDTRSSITPQSAKSVNTDPRSLAGWFGRNYCLFSVLPFYARYEKHEFSRTYFQELLLKGLVGVNGKPHVLVDNNWHPRWPTNFEVPLDVIFIEDPWTRTRAYDRYLQGIRLPLELLGLPEEVFTHAVTAYEKECA